MSNESNATATQPALYQQQRFVFMTIDPVHVGAGGYRLGRVDQTIIREPGTNLPKVPGTSLAGAARSYAALRYGKPEAAGQHKNLKQERKASCPIIYTFGTATDTGGGQAGTVSVGDAYLLFFPVYSMAGPVWVSTKERVQEAWGTESVKTLPVEPSDSGQTVTSMAWENGTLNLGWLLLAIKQGLEIVAPLAVSGCSEWKAIAARIVLVGPKVFSQIVNSNLEVRTSVSIDPETGAAEEGALFTYEAIPRAAWLWCDVVQDNYRELNKRATNGQSANGQPTNADKFPVTTQQYNGQENAGEELGETWRAPLDVLRAGSRLIEHLGIGGMGTRGFGRMRLLGDYAYENGARQ